MIQRSAEKSFEAADRIFVHSVNSVAARQKAHFRFTALGTADVFAPADQFPAADTFSELTILAPKGGSAP
jgi:hypothetical protein